MTLRISGGALAGRRIDAPAGGLRPTQERVREALFSMLAGKVPGCRFLDLFAGTGMVGLEAASRGAAAVVWVESNRRAYDDLQRSVRQLLPDRDGFRTYLLDVQRFLRHPPAGCGRFDLIFADPPYRRGRDGVEEDWGMRLLEVLPGSGLLQQGGLLVYEDRVGGSPAARESWELVRDRQYGDARLRVYRWQPQQVGGAADVQGGG